MLYSESVPKKIGTGNYLELQRKRVVEAGAVPCCVYTLAELRILLNHHRERPLSVFGWLQVTGFDSLIRFFLCRFILFPRWFGLP